MVNEIFSECRLEGDFVLSSGRKSSYFYDFDLLKPEETTIYVKQLIDSLPKEITKDVDFIAAPAIGGIVPGFLIAFALGKPFVQIDKEGKLRGPEFKAAKYLIVDDVITTYQAIGKVIGALESNTCIGAASFIFRGHFEDLQKYDFPTFFLSKKEPEFG